jgi:hypothetical protein
VALLPTFLLGIYHLIVLIVFYNRLALELMVVVAESQRRMPTSLLRVPHV